MPVSKISKLPFFLLDHTTFFSHLANTDAIDEPTYLSLLATQLLLAVDVGTVVDVYDTLMLFEGCC